MSGLPVAFVVCPHRLVIEYGDCEFFAECGCGAELGSTRPDQSLDVLGGWWEQHVLREHRDCNCWSCSL